MDHLDYILSLLCFEVEQVDGGVVVQMADRVEAGASVAADGSVVGLA